MILGGQLPGKVGRRRLLIIWLHGQAVKTPPFHGGNPGSIPGGVTKRARVAELADALDLGSSGRPWGFKSLRAHQFKKDILRDVFFHEKEHTSVEKIASVKKSKHTWHLFTCKRLTLRKP